MNSTVDTVFCNKIHFWFIKKDAKEGIYKDIGDGLRRHPEFFVPFEKGFGTRQVVKGTSAYIDVYKTSRVYSEG